MPEMFATMTSVALADLICYPFETVLHRLYIQGIFQNFECIKLF